MGTDLSRAGRRSLAEVIGQAERGGDDGFDPFDWDGMLDIGDLSGSQTPPDDEEREEVVRQYAASTKHPREHFVTAHHHVLKGTTVASTDWQGVDAGYHGRFDDGAPIGASYLYWVEGWYAPAERTAPLKKPFSWTA